MSRPWEAGDVAGFVALLARDAVWAMPPWREWFVGREAIAAFITWAWRDAPYRHRLVRTTPNGQPAFGYYRPARNGGELEAFAIQVIDVDARASPEYHQFRRAEALLRVRSSRNCRARRAMTCRASMYRYG